MPVDGRPEDLGVGDFRARLQPLLPQLDDVDAGGQYGVKELGQVALALPRVRAQVEPGVGKPVLRRSRRQNATACARRLTSVPRFSTSACTGVPGSESSGW